MKTTTTISLKVVLEHDDEMTGHEAQELFLEKLPERFGHVCLNHAEITEGLLDEDDVPVGPRVSK